jgi:hypothetical protein
VDRAQGEVAEPTGEGRQQRRQRAGALDHDEAPARRQQRETGDDPVSQRRRAFPRDVAARRCGGEVGRVGDDKIGRLVGEPGAAAAS